MFTYYLWKLDYDKLSRIHATTPSFRIISSISLNCDVVSVRKIISSLTNVEYADLNSKLVKITGTQLIPLDILKLLADHHLVTVTPESLFDTWIYNYTADIPTYTTTCKQFGITPISNSDILCNLAGKFQYNITNYIYPIYCDGMMTTSTMS